MRYVFLISAVLGALAGYYALWSHLQGQIEQGVQLFLNGQRALGRIAEIGVMRRGGFPYRLSLRLERLNLADPSGPTRWQLGAEDIVLHFQLWSFRHGIAEIPGRVTLGWRDGDGRQRVFSLRAGESGRASLVIDSTDRWDRLAVDLRQVTFDQDLEGYSAGQVLFHARRGESLPATHDVALQVERLKLPPRLDGPLGREVAELRLIGRQSGPWLGDAPETLLRNWRDAGGIVEFETVRLKWGDLAISGDGTLALDRQFRLLGAMGSRITGAATALDALAAAGKVPAKDAALAKSALQALEKRDAAGPPYLPLPITAQDGRLMIASIPLLDLPSLMTWVRPAP